MMLIYIKSIFRVLILSIFLGLISFSAYGQQWGVVEKSNITQQIGNQVYFLHNVVKGNTLYSLAKVYGVSVNEIKAANPGMQDELKLGAVILIPKAKEAESTVTTPAISFDNYFYHVVKQGESLFSISRIYEVNVNDLVKLNELSSNKISPGFYLKIPEMKLQSIDLPKEVEQQQITTKESRYFEHIVQPKETLYSIAKRYGIGVETLKYINNFTGNSLQSGQTVLIPKVLKDWQTRESKNYIIHQVKPKENLYGIARKYGVSIDQIKAINLGLSTALSIGQEIKIPRKSNIKGYIEHQVSDRKEKLSNIAQDYQVSVSNLKDLNPGAPSKVRRGETVFIPIDFIDKTKEVLAIDFPEEEKPIKIDSVFFVDPAFYELNKDRVFNVALMLPLYLNDVDSMLSIDQQKLLANRGELRAFRFLEFYEGAQIAVDSLRQLGMQLNFHVYDVTEDEMKTALLLQDRALSKMDLIISLLFRRSFTLVSNFSKENRIPLVNVLSKRGQIIYENPYVFKISPKPEALYDRVADFVGKNFSNSNTIIVRNNPYQLTSEYNLISGLLNEKINSIAPFSNSFALQKIETYMEGRQETYLDTLVREINKTEYSFNLNRIIDNPYDTVWVDNSVKTVIYSNDSLNGIMQQASLFRDNLIVALGSDEVFAIELFTKLNFVRDSLNIKVIGLPDWHSFENLDVNYSQPFTLRVLSENFVDYNSSATKRFVDKFQWAYNKVPEIEKYSFLGYDATFYFLQALFRFGDDLVKNIEDFQIPLLQNQFKFERQNRRGFENTYWNLYRQENYQYKLEK
ncbi:MAG: LysM peptidoglycan-binding domain-containing protein [Bacteroidales bacterium]|jgi:LysM repeat protein/ABC-type branched-subunit amino acid transport system substrate-binding protein|nr:LysM peptidoglycan-binding domain-containing protein [Bacteroidales bacterium]